MNYKIEFFNKYCILNPTPSLPLKGKGVEHLNLFPMRFTSNREINLSA